MLLFYTSPEVYTIIGTVSKYDATAFPKAPNYLTRGLHAYEAALASKGVRFEIKKNSKGISEIHLTMTIRTPIMIGRTPILSETA